MAITQLLAREYREGRMTSERYVQLFALRTAAWRACLRWEHGVGEPWAEIAAMEGAMR